MTKLNFGNLEAEGQEARFQLGPLYCGGEANEHIMAGPGSCHSLWKEANMVPGYHMVKGWLVIILTGQVSGVGFNV